MPNLLTGGHVDRGGAVIRREVIFRWESVDRVDLGQNPAGDDRSDAVELGEPGAGAVDQRSDLRADGFHLRVQRPDVVEVLVSQLVPPQTAAIDEEPLDSRISETTRMVYGNLSSSGMRRECALGQGTVADFAAARAAQRFVSPVENGGKL